MKMRFKRFLSGFMAVATLASVIIQPVAVSASELEPEEITRIQNETAKIAQRYRKQKAQAQQVPTQEAQHVQEGSIQGDSQSINNEQVPVQQPMVDMGDMEL